MNIKKIIAIDEVADDLDDGENFYDKIESGIGTYFRDCIIADIESLILYAGIHSKHNGYYRKLAERFPYAIYYEIEDEAAIVIAVLDMRRDPKRIIKNLNKRKTQPA